MTDLLVTHIRRDGSDPDRRIDLLQGPWFGPATIDDVIQDIIAGRHRYYVSGNSVLPLAYLEVVRPNGLLGYYRPYLRTIPDGKFDNNLYALPEIA